jgi:plasmid stabilization system protein ParE
MNLPVVFGPRARKEFDAAADYYRAIRPALAHQFTDAVTATLNLVAHQPEIGTMIGNNRRQILATGFPYKIWYRIVGGKIRVVALIHGKRKRTF